MSDGKRPILVTGAHRTGTTWVGRLLAAAPGVAYISEPLNVLHRPGVFGAQVAHWYTYICPQNQDQFLPAFRDLLAFRYHFLSELGAIRSLRDLARMGRDLAIFTGGRLGQRTPLFKDPFAVFSQAWYASALGCRIVVTVRHPAAFASGLKRLRWTFEFSDLLQQPLLMRDHLEPYRREMEAVPAGDVIGQAGLLWALIYRTLQVFVRADPTIEVVRHEDLSQDPAGGFKRLYEVLDLAHTAKAERTIKESSSSENPTELSRGRTHSVKLDSRASLQNWKHRLSAEEVARLRALTDGVWQHYYSEVSWN